MSATETFRSSVMVDELDGLRLTGLGRIARCADCPRYRALVDAHRGSKIGAGKLPVSLPDVPDNCSYAYCAPLAARYVKRPGTVAAPGTRRVMAAVSAP